MNIKDIQAEIEATRKEVADMESTARLVPGLAAFVEVGRSHIRNLEALLAEVQCAELAEAQTRELKPFHVTWTLEVSNTIWAESAHEADAALKGYDIGRACYDTPNWADAEVTIYPSHHKTQFEAGNEVVDGGKLLDPHNLPFRVVPKGGAQ